MGTPLEHARGLAKCAASLYWRLRLKAGQRLAGRRARGAAVGQRAPDFRLQDAAGRAFSLARCSPGKAAVLWMTNLCSSCREKIPLLEETWRAHKGRLEVFAISTLGPDRETPERVFREHRLSFPLLLDPEDWVGKTLGLAHPPGACPLYNLLFLDSSGTIRRRDHLSALSETAFRKRIEELLAG